MSQLTEGKQPRTQYKHATQCNLPHCPLQVVGDGAASWLKHFAVACDGTILGQQEAEEWPIQQLKNHLRILPNLLVKKFRVEVTRPSNTIEALRPITCPGAPLRETTGRNRCASKAHAGDVVVDDNQMKFGLVCRCGPIA